MGLLDEAIKQHLELKRRRGADPGEVDRLEREALGPVRRLQEAPPEGDEPAGDADIAYEEDAYAEEPYDEYELGPEADYELEDEEPELPPRPPPSAAEGAPVNRPGPESLGAHGVVPPQTDAGADELTEPEEPEPHEPDDHLGVETVEYDVEAEHAREERRPDVEEPEDLSEEAQGDTAEADMLEETPEFFQDAPDHDRLWFEQRPPKDFDFDG